MKISHRVIGASAPVAQKNFYHTNPPSAWQLQKRREQVFELRQQIQTTSPDKSRRSKQLQKKLQQLECQQGIDTSPKSTLNPSASAWSPTIASPIIRPKTPLDPSAPVWSHLPASPIIGPKIPMFAIPEPAKHVVHQEHKWGPGGLNPYTYKLLGSSLLEAINTLGGNTLSLSTVNTDDDDVSDFDLGSSVSGTSSIIDSGYESRESNSSGDESEISTALPYLTGQEYLLSLLSYAPGHGPK